MTTLFVDETKFKRWINNIEKSKTKKSWIYLHNNGEDIKRYALRYGGVEPDSDDDVEGEEYLFFYMGKVEYKVKQECKCCNCNNDIGIK